MPYTDINTSLSDLMSGFDIPEDIQNTLYDYDKSGEKNLWGQLGVDKKLMQNQLTQLNTKVDESGIGFSGMGQRKDNKNIMSHGVNDKFSGMLDNTMYKTYELKKDWHETQMGTIADAITSGDVTVDDTVYTFDVNNSAFYDWAYEQSGFGGFDELDDSSIQLLWDQWVSSTGSGGSVGGGGSGCFQEGTSIQLADGILPIEQIKIDDIVKTFNVDTNSVETSKVMQTFVHENNVDGLLINGLIKTTTDHRFYSDGEWIAAGKLSIGDKILHVDGVEHKIETLELNSELKTVYNFEVYGTHNYFAEGYLVHNKKEDGPGG